MRDRAPHPPARYHLTSLTDRTEEHEWTNNPSATTPSGAGYNVVLRLVGDTEEVLIQTRWKDRDGKPTVVEAGHLSKTVITAEAEADGDGEAEADGEGSTG
jgi:hypothetical protein